MADDKSDGQIRFGRQVGPDAVIAIRRDADGNEHEVMVRPGGDGAPMLPSSEIAHISPEDSDGWHEVQTLYRNGPAQVATPKYREGYDRIFGKKPDVGLA